MYMIKNMEEILKQLMNTRCIAMHNSSMRCYGKGCNGQCAQFQVALDAIITKNCKWLSNNKDNYIIDIEGETIVDEKIVDDFRKTMEE